MAGTAPFESAADGTLVLHESRRFLRRFLCVAALVLVAIVTVVFVAVDRSNGSLLVGGLAGAAGMVSLAAVLNDLRIVLDQSRQRLTWGQSNLVRTRYVEVAFAEVRKVFVLESRSRDDDDRVGGYIVRYRPMLRTITETLPLSMSEGPDRAASQALCDAVVRIIAGGTSPPDASSGAEATLQAGRLVDAVAMIRAQRSIGLAEARRIASEMAASHRDRSNPDAG